MPIDLVHAFAVSTPAPRSILVLAEGQLGDLLLLTPALRAMRNSFPGAQISVLILQRRGMAHRGVGSGEPVRIADPAGTGCVLTSSSAVNHVYEVNRNALKAMKGVDRVKGETGIVRWLRRGGFDAVICTFPEDRFAVLAYLSRARVRLGQRKQKLHWLLNVKPDIRKSDRGVLQYYCDLARALGASCVSEKTEFAVSLEAMRWAEECIALQCGNARPPVIIHPGASGDYKIWPLERYAALADRLQSEGIPVLLCGAQGDREVVNKVRLNARRPVPVIVTEGNLQRLAGLFTRSALVVCNDSGPRHLAVAAGAATLALFRLHHDVEWNVYPESPRCRILRGNSSCPSCPPDACADRVPGGERYGSHCMRLITVDEAMTAIRAMITS